MSSVIWKGTIRFDPFRIPVKILSAIEDQAVHFHLLHAKDGVRVKQKLVNPITGNDVPPERIKKGYEVASGTFVLLGPDELHALEPKESRDIEIIRFVPKAALGTEWYERPYYLAPDEDDDAYFAFSEALRRSERQALARWTMRRKRYLGALRPLGEHLVLATLRHSEEVVVTPELEGPPSERDPKEVALAEQLVSALSGDFDPTAFHDEHRARLLELIATKARGESVKIRRAPPRPREAPLTKSLQKSLDTLKRTQKKERKSA